MRITLPNLVYAARHPLRALRYLRFRDMIPYEVIARHLPANPIILEAGAHDGSNSLEMAEFWPGGVVHAFEPVPQGFDVLKKRTEAMPGRIHCWPVGLGPQKTTMKMHVSGGGGIYGSQSSSFLAPTHIQTREFSFVSFEKEIDVQVETIDSWAQANSVERLDFLWLDMQGYEIEALRGAERILGGVSAIQIEVAHLPLYHGAPLYPEVRKWLWERGFQPCVEAVFRVGGNVLFTRAS